jgi:hypothetical protein
MIAPTPKPQKTSQQHRVDFARGGSPRAMFPQQAADPVRPGLSGGKGAGASETRPDVDEE